ncbi:MAG: hypothetical protein WCA20_33835 [Candidatus Sulfotelmatobacter sp.]
MPNSDSKNPRVYSGSINLMLDQSAQPFSDSNRHHRGQIYVYLAMLGVSTPPNYGLTSEEVRAKSQ